MRFNSPTAGKHLSKSTSAGARWSYTESDEQFYREQQELLDLITNSWTKATTLWRRLGMKDRAPAAQVKAIDTIADPIERGYAL